jgi:cytoskeleton-associated protein 5
MSDIKLVNHNLDEIFNDDPVRLPQRTLMGRRQFSPPSAASAHSALLQSPIAAARNPQMMMQQPRANLSEMPEAYEALDVVLAQILSQDSTTCIGALKQLEELIKDKDKVLLMSHRMDQLLSGCYMQYRHVLNNKMKTDNCDPSDVMRIFQYLTMVLMSMYHHAEITRTASTSAIHDLVHVIICVLLEPDVAGYPQGSQLIRALNVLTVKIVDRSDHTCITSAFLRLLRESVGNPCLAPKYVELVMKCLWKVIRSLANNGWMDDLNLDLVLADLHDFLKAYPSSYWKTQDSDTPVRTVKTVLHTLTKYKGEEILDHLTRIQDPENSELVAYLRKLLNSGIGKENSANGTEAESSGSAIDTNNKQQAQKSKAAQRFSKSDHETLADIFKKIGQKELTKQGLQELYNFKKQNPDANLSPFLDKSSQYFRDYIERGLKNIEMELGNGGVGSHASNGFGFGGGSGSVLSDVASGNAQQIAPHMQYMERLTKLREQGGLHSANSAVDGTVASSGVSSASSAYRISASSSVVSSASSYQRVEQRHQYEEVDESALAAEAEAAQQQQQQQAATAANVEDIRKRLERIKQSAF